MGRHIWLRDDQWDQVVDGIETKMGNIGKAFHRRKPQFWIWELRSCLQKGFFQKGVEVVVEGWDEVGG